MKLLCCLKDKNNTEIVCHEQTVMSRVAGDIQSSSRRNSGGRRLVLKPLRARRKTLEAGSITKDKLNPHVTPGPGLEPGSQLWEANALTTAWYLLPRYKWGVGRSIWEISGCKTSDPPLPLGSKLTDPPLIEGWKLHNHDNPPPPNKILVLQNLI